jgi:hypothetical protein
MSTTSTPRFKALWESVVDGTAPTDPSVGTTVSATADHIAAGGCPTCNPPRDRENGTLAGRRRANRERRAEVLARVARRNLI